MKNEGVKIPLSTKGMEAGVAQMGEDEIVREDYYKYLESTWLEICKRRPVGGVAFITEAFKKTTLTYRHWLNRRYLGNFEGDIPE
jgi:hypothetical protein